ncbi:lysR family transcriptional regulator [Acetobacter aceti NRIC 0242]|uniref:LysR family transcriptional regulator n=1 Tax=Acetobacter aceti NBRC 14818 TaxID=887700 RepID=A0AB33IEI4_ACEAC|nr:LysR family transcriptional regulator [Acetobacter aceti]TCS28394.1 DNA-binding transcriptional LysR family regulator [Acetobacter aceti NBRC 14818]BCK76327.1 LysR family transcriptional regulator [Acetobacter aceti NBRC 14818]GAN58918.1 transcriptional regulator LysR [Acetobacter aceti NBRC 14818]GBO80537.1 lysR family transcriptional regulator [Acetobacter aceti NRIC 0242]
MALRDLPFDLSSLNVFLAVCENGSMAAAARALSVTQPAISQTISELETRLGTRLFDRNVRPLALTATGAVLRQNATGLLAEMRHIAVGIQEMKHGRVPQLRLGVVDSLSRAILPHLSEFMYERVGRLVVHAGLTESHGTSLLTRQIDLVIGVDEMEDVAGLERWPLIEEPYLLLCPDNVAPPKTTDDMRALLLNHPFIRFSQRSRTGLEVERYLRRLRIDVPFQQEYDLPYGVFSACRAGGVAITTPLCLYEVGFRASSGMVCHPLPVGSFHRHLTLVGRRREFGRLPLDLMLYLRERLHTGMMRDLVALFPEFSDQIRILS